jgi:hypothetical protein
MRLKIRWFYYLIIIVSIYHNSALGKDNKFGEMFITIDKQDSINLGVRMAFLYKNVNVKYDSTILVQNKENSEIKLYPQLVTGDKNVLRIMAGDIEEQEPLFFDLFFIIGDTVQGKINWVDEREKIYITYNGILQSQKIQTDHINGTVSFKTDKKGQVISGILKLRFQAPLFSENGSLNEIKLNGSFDLAVGDYRDLTVGKNLSDIQEKKKRRQNIYVAVFLTVFLVAIFGFR